MPYIKFSENVSKYVNGITELRLPDQCTVEFALTQICSEYPQFAVMVLDNTGLMLILNDSELLETSDATLILQSGDFLYIEEAPKGNAGAITGALVSYGMSVAVAQVATYVIIAAIQIGVSYAISAIIGALSDNVASPDQGINTLNNSATYTFSGIQNTTASGTPIAMVYGTHRVGGQVLNVATGNEGTENNYLLAQYGLSEGEVEGISDVHINKLPVGYFNEVSTAPQEAYVRYGKETQEPMPAFSQTRNTTSINARVLNLQNLPTTRSPIFSAPKFIYGYVDYTNLFDVRLSIGTYKWRPEAPLPDGYDPTNGWVTTG